MSDSPPDDGPPPMLAGDLLAPGYRVVAHLRRGEDLDVYDLWSDVRGCRCIGKAARPDRADRRKVRERLLLEGRRLLRLSHPHIVRAYEVVTVPSPIVILETLPGETVAHLIDRLERRLSAREIAQLGLHLCSATGYLHHNGILHLDLKPSNVIATHGMAKVLDLSVARPPGPSKGPIGTLGYRAPEQALGGELGPYSDVWGIGVTLFEAATGQPARDAADEATTVDIAAELCRPAPVRRFRRLPASLAQAIDRSLSLAPDERPSVVALAKLLRTGF
jgi:serine/threonine protein kinase